MDTDLYERLQIEKENAPEALRRAVEAGEEVWTTQTLQKDFEVIGFLAPFVVVRRRSDGAKGSLQFTHSPRYYFGWKGDEISTSEGAE